MEIIYNAILVDVDYYTLMLLSYTVSDLPFRKLLAPHLNL